MAEVERIQKVLAAQGVGSRRQIEQMIREGRIMVGNDPAELGQKISAEDRVFVDGKQIRLRDQEKRVPRVILFHKDEGQLCSRKASERSESIFESLPRLRNARWCMVGRLDVNTSGLILFTTSGELANKLAHPSSEIEREYAVRVFGEVEQSHIKAMMAGVEDKGERLKFDSVRFQGGEGKNSWYHVTLRTGKNREVRRLWASQGFTISRLIRVRFGHFLLPPRLKKKKYQELERDEVKRLIKSLQK